MTADKELLGAITRLSHDAKSYFDHQALYRPDFQPQEIKASLETGPSRTDLDALRVATEAALSSHPVFGKDKLLFFGAKQLLVGPKWQAWNLLKVAHTQGADGAVAWLQKLYTTTHADVRYVVEVHGLKLDQQVGLSNGVRLIPLGKLPQTRQAADLVARYSPDYRFRDGIFDFTQPLFAPLGGLLEVLGVPATETQNKRWGDSEQYSAKLEYTIRAFVLADYASPIIGVGWAEFMDADLAAADIGQAAMLPAHESNVNAIHPVSVDQTAVELVERYLRLPSKMRRACDIANERLALARRRRHPGNKAIEGAICLEALLGDGGSQELTYRVKLRAALLLGKTLGERRSISRAVGDFYALRSKTVHGNDVVRDSGQHDRAERGLAICADVLRAIVDLGKPYVPQDWELSGGRPEEPNR